MWVWEHRMGQYTWSKGETLRELRDRKDEIMAKHLAAIQRARDGATYR
jgi:hypothetical protein